MTNPTMAKVSAQQRVVITYWFC